MKYHSNTRKARGFTLMEIMVVLAILGVLAAILVPTFGKIRRASMYRQVLSSVDNMNVAIAAYSDKFGPVPVTENIVDITGVVATNCVGHTGADVSNKLRLEHVLRAMNEDMPLFDTNLSENLPPIGDAAGLPFPDTVSYNSTLRRFQVLPTVSTNVQNWAGRPRFEAVITTAAGNNPLELFTGSAADATSFNTAQFNFFPTGTTPLATGVKMYYLEIPNIKLDDAVELMRRKNPEMEDAGAAAGTAVQRRGKVIFPCPVNGYTTVRVFVSGSE